MPSIFVFVFTSNSLLGITFVALQKPRQRNFRKLQRSGGSRFGGSEKIVNFWRFWNGSINWHGITSEESWFLISQIMLPRHVYVGWKFQRTLKLGMSFSLEHFFIAVAISTKVASAPLSTTFYITEIPPTQTPLKRFS